MLILSDVWYNYFGFHENETIHQQKLSTYIYTWDVFISFICNNIFLDQSLLSVHLMSWTYTWTDLPTGKSENSRWTAVCLWLEQTVRLINMFESYTWPYTVVDALTVGVKRLGLRDTAVREHISPRRTGDDPEWPCREGRSQWLKRWVQKRVRSPPSHLEYNTASPLVWIPKFQKDG